ncbi:MAG: J domain-containing protein [Alicyclobacillaceae bacterium]|nr:J domain-containing protein [Alicyclobacillaceae bacterium]
MTKHALDRAFCGRCGQRLALTYYDVLAVPASASAAELKHAYRRLAARWHPDRNPSPEAAAVFACLTEAYRTLADPARRQRYDAALAAQRRDGVSGTAATGAPSEQAGVHDDTDASRTGESEAGGWLYEALRFAGLTAASFAGLTAWAVHHAAYPLLSTAAFAASCVVWMYGVIALLHFVATGRRLRGVRRAKVSARMERV